MISTVPLRLRLIDLLERDIFSLHHRKNNLQKRKKSNFLCLIKYNKYIIRTKISFYDYELIFYRFVRGRWTFFTKFNPARPVVVLK